MSKEFRVILVGAGGVGIRLAEDLARMLEYQAPGSGMIIVDGDTFEDKNRARQNFDVMGNKAEVLAARLTAQEFNNTLFLPLPQWVVETVENTAGEDEAPDLETKVAASELLGDGDIVFAVVDNFAARKLLFDVASTIDNIDVFTGGNDEALFGSIYHYQRRNGEDITHHPVVFHDEYDNPPDRNPGEMSCQERAEIDGGTQTIAANAGVAAYLLARASQVMFDETFDPGPESEIYFDLGKGKALPHNRSVSYNTVTEGVTLNG